jgi:glycosyltransferase involved in cell wall biosynthesis
MTWATMMHRLGHEVILFAGPENEAEVTEHINCQNGYEWTERIPPYDDTHPGWSAFAEKAIAEIGKRIQPGDYLCLAAGWTQKPIADAFPNNRAVEFITGYQGTLPNSFRVFPSYTWQSAVYAHQMTAAGADGRLYDTVIPHFIDPSEHSLGDGSGDYMLYVGRLTERKGLKVVADIAARNGRKLIVAGFGNESLIPPGATFVGSVEPALRSELMRNARCVIMPTLYIEPFGMVAIESMAAGTPVINTDFGAFSETNIHGETGFRCHTLAEFCEAVESSGYLNRQKIHEYAIGKYSTDAIGPQYEKYFNRLDTLNGAGWYA